jgi:signal transduction histidine kinase
MSQVNAEHLLQDLLHEVKNLNDSIKESCEFLGKSLISIQAANAEEAKHYAARIHFTSQQISQRLEFVAAEQNPDALKNGGIATSSIYGKFLKVKKMLAHEMSRRRIKVRFEGHSAQHVDLYYTFDIVPFSLLVNAVKYSPKEGDVSVIFDETRERLKVAVESMGPLLAPAETSRLFDRGFRGEWACKTDGSGRGIGLYFAKTICQLHGFDIEIDAGREPAFLVDGVPYARFRVNLTIPCQ